MRPVCQPVLQLVSFEVQSQELPQWIKNNAKWWSSESISDNEFIRGIQFLIDEGLIVNLQTETISSSNQQIPDWVKNNAKWWSENQISDEDFVKSLQYLVNKGIIRV